MIHDQTVELVNAGQIDEAMRLIELNPDCLSFSDVNQWSLIHYAAKHGQLEFIQFLLDQQSELINLRNDLGQTPLLLAVSNGHIPVAMFLAKYVADLSVHAILYQFNTIREQSSIGSEFALLFDSVAQTVKIPETCDINLHESIITLLGFHELVARTQPNNIFFSPRAPENYFVLCLAFYMARKTGQSMPSILYARSLTWPENTGEWYDPISGGSELLIDPSQFAITSDGQICQLDYLMDTAISLFLDGHSEHDKIWQSNDPRRLNKSLPDHFIHSLCSHFPVFKQFYDRVSSVSMHTPLRYLQALREGLRNGSKVGHDSHKKGDEYNAGTAANEAIAIFSVWWEHMSHIRYDEHQTLQQKLKTLKTGYRLERTLGDFFSIILRDTSAGISESMHDAATCVQLRGDELESAINLNRQFLSSLEKKELTDRELDDYKRKILLAFQLGQQRPIITQSINNQSSIISSEPQQLPYFAYAITQLWGSFCVGDLNDTSIIELERLVRLMSKEQRQQLWAQRVDFYGDETTKLKTLRHTLRSIDKQSEENMILPEAERHQFKPADHALMAIIACNRSLLVWILHRYEFIVFTNPFLVDLVLREGIEATLNEGTFIIRDAFNFAYYAMSKTQYLDNGKQKQDKLLTYFLEVPNVLLISFPISPIQLQIKANNLEACKKILDENPNYLTHVFWESGDSCLGVAAINGRGAICKLLLEHGANPGLKNKRGKTAEELWPLSEADNPFVQFRDELYQVVTKKGGLSEARRTQLLTLVIQYPHFLTLSVHKNGYNPLQYAFATNQTVMIEQILNLPEWNDLSKTKSKKGWSLFDIIAMNGQLAYYERLNLLPEDSSDWAFALRVSVIYNQEAFCRRLLADGVHPESIIASDGSTSLMIAAANGNSAMCNLLLKSGVNPLLKNKRSKAAVELWPSSVANNPFLQFGNELYYLATQKEGLSDARRTELLTLVIQYPHFLTFYIDQYQNNVVHYAFACNHTALIEKMLNLPEWNALSKTKNKKGWILFDMIALSGNLAYYEYLKPLPEDSYAWAFALRLAVENGHEEFCRLILAHGVKQSLMPDHHGVTPLMIAASNGNSPLCILLVECGADPKFKDLHGRIAEHYWPSSAVANPFLIWSFERRKAQLIQLIEDKISNAFWPERTVSSQKKAKLRDLQQKIAEGIVSAVDSSDMSSDDMLNEIVSAWETDNLKSNISNKILFFLPKNHSYGLIHSIVHDIKIILGPKSATSQNQIDRSRLNIRY